jgi:hypothetical protein
MVYTIEPMTSTAGNVKSVFFSSLGFDRGYQTTFSIKNNQGEIEYLARLDKQLSVNKCVVEDSNSNLLFEIEETFDHIDKAYSIKIEHELIQISKSEYKEEYNVTRNGFQLMTLNPQSKWDIVAFFKDEQLGQSVNIRRFKFIHTNSYHFVFGNKYDKRLMLAVFFTWMIIVEEMKTTALETGWDLINEILPMTGKVTKKGDLNWDPDI